MPYQVTAPLVLAKTAEGGDIYCYQDAFVPAGQDAEWIERHLADGMIADVAGPAADGAPAEDPDAKPSRGASHAKWVTYALAHDTKDGVRLDQDGAEALSRNDLADLFPDE